MPAVFVWLPARLDRNNDFRLAGTDMVFISMNCLVVGLNWVKRQKKQ